MQIFRVNLLTAQAFTIGSGLLNVWPRPFRNSFRQAGRVSLESAVSWGVVGRVDDY